MPLKKYFWVILKLLNNHLVPFKKMKILKLSGNNTEADMK